MKIQLPQNIFRPVDTIRSKREGQGGAAGQQYDAMFQQNGKRGGGSQSQSDDQTKDGQTDSGPRDVEPAVLELALKIFEEDAKAKASGLSAEKEGHGPGLKIILKDVSGRVIRSLSGQEFLKLREGAAQDTKARGKLLDQKF